MKNTKLKKSKIAQKGITLIALVITIIVLLILAGVSIATLTGENGILTRANDAKVNTSIGEEKDAIGLAYNAVMTDSLGDGVEAGKLQDELRNNGYTNATAVDNGDGKIKVTFPDTGRSYLVDGNGNIVESDTIEDAIGNIKEYTSDGVPIPKGFYYVGGTKEEGVVISDSSTDENKGASHEVAETLTGNQFVWIPVQNFNDFVRKAGYANGNLQNCVFETKEPKENVYYEEVSDGEKNDTEIEKMYKSVKENKGFYIGRYETGIEGDEQRTKSSGINDKAVIKEDKIIYDYIDWEQSKTVATMFASDYGYESVTSTLCYGVQWDATMAFIDNQYLSENCETESYVRNSEGRGNYINYGSNISKTGTNENYMIKNIYDLAGNAEEWTMERYGESNYVRRGGPYLYYSTNGLKHPASWRDDLDKSAVSQQNGFRVTLFIK